MAQPELADVLLNPDFILFFVMVRKLDMVEFSTLGKFSTVTRVATRRKARPKVLGEMVSEMVVPAVNPINDDQNMEEIQCDLDKPRIAPY